MNQSELKHYLNSLVEKYNHPQFIENDPISIPHLFTKKEDIEIIGFWTAMLAWGQRKTIISKAKQLIELMDGAPYDFIMNHNERDLKPFLSFKHRTFNSDDTFYFLHFFKRHYNNQNSLETAFHAEGSMYDRLQHFHDYFFNSEFALQRTKKHVSTPIRNSACKRLNMFMRWMVRKDENGVDFGIWKSISPSELMIPLDVHVFNVATKLGLVTRTKSDWKTVEELTNRLREFDSQDPVKYDYALFSLGIDKTSLPI